MDMLCQIDIIIQTHYMEKVYRIEMKKHYECMVVSVNGVLLWKVRDELLQYDIGKLILINPLMNDDFKNLLLELFQKK